MKRIASFTMGNKESRPDKIVLSNGDSLSQKLYSYSPQRPSMLASIVEVEEGIDTVSIKTHIGTYKIRRDLLAVDFIGKRFPETKDIAPKKGEGSIQFISPNGLNIFLASKILSVSV